MKSDIFNIIKNNLNNLVIDDSDSSINYHTSEINSKINLNIDELYNIFKNNNNDIFKCNTIDCLTFILTNGQEVSLHDYVQDQSQRLFKMFPELLKIKVPELSATNNDIIIAIHHNHHIAKSKIWDFSDKQVGKLYSSDTAITDYNGYDNCQRFLKLNPYATNNRAIVYCNHLMISISGTIYQGYLPAAGQLYILFKYIDMINHVLDFVNAQKIYYMLVDNNYWTSTEWREKYAWYYWERKPYQSLKDQSGGVLPFFKKL